MSVTEVQLRSSCAAPAEHSEHRPLDCRAADPSSPPLALGQPLAETVYTPESSLRRPAVMLVEMLADLMRSRELAWRMFVRDTKAAYRQSLLGYLWILGPPLASMILFTFLQSQKILNVGHTDVPYPVFVLMGTILWQAFSGAVSAPLGAVAGAAGMLSKLNFPREALLLTSLYHALFNLGVKLVLLAVVMAWFQVGATWTIVLAPLGIIALIGFGYTLGLLLVPLGILYQDVGRGITMATGIWMLLTPVIYPVPTTWPASLINWLNPVTPLLVTTRELATTGQPSQLAAFVVVSGATVLLFLVGWVLYRVTMPHLIARMAA